MIENIKAARLLTQWVKSDQELVALSLEDYKLYLDTIKPVMYTHTKDGEVFSVSVNRQEAIEYLTHEHNLHRFVDISC